MRGLALLLIIIAVPLAVAGTAAANSTQTTVVTIHDTSDFGEATEACGFPVDLRVDGSFKITDYFDNSGTLFKEIITIFRVSSTATAINPANGKSTTTQSQSFVTIVQFNPDGSVASASNSGPIYNFRRSRPRHDPPIDWTPRLRLELRHRLRSGAARLRRREQRRLLQLPGRPVSR
jgi:hypothetical protein